MNEQNGRIIRRLVDSVDAFIRGGIDLEDIQARLQSAEGLLERDSSAVIRAIHLAEADLESIRFTLLLDEQRPAAVFRLDELRAGIAEAWSEDVESFDCAGTDLCADLP
jgi:hypothetical protein